MADLKLVWAMHLTAADTPPYPGATTAKPVILDVMPLQAGTLLWDIIVFRHVPWNVDPDVGYGAAITFGFKLNEDHGSGFGSASNPTSIEWFDSFRLDDEVTPFRTDDNPWVSGNAGSFGNSYHRNPTNVMPQVMLADAILQLHYDSAAGDVATEGVADIYVLVEQPPTEIIQAVGFGVVEVAGEPPETGAAFLDTGVIEIQGQPPTIAYGPPPPPSPGGGGGGGGPSRSPIGGPSNTPAGPGTGPPSAHIPSDNLQLIYDDSDNILPDVLWSTARFRTAVNGVPGECSFQLRIVPGHPRTLVAGKRLLLKIFGVPAWDGYVQNIHHGYFFEASDTSEISEVPQFLGIQGVDVNILFKKRFTRDPVHPERLDGKLYKFDEVTGERTKDITALMELVHNWLDLEGDNLDLESQIDNVDFINVDQDVSPWGGGWSWEQAMISLNKLPAAIWGIDPDRALYWVDVDKANAPWPLDDHQSDTTAAYREVEVIFDGNDLITDVMAWGAGTGSAKMVFKRIQNDPDGHGLWQYGELHYNVYKQATIDRIAYAWIFGSPGSRRGHRYDKISVKLVTFVNGFRAGHKVELRVRDLNYLTESIPIRAMEITFPAPYMPRYEMVLSHELDAPWNFYDAFTPTLPVVHDFPVNQPMEPNLGCLFKPCLDGWYLGSGYLLFTDYFDRDTSVHIGNGWTDTGIAPATVGGPPWCILIRSRSFDELHPAGFPYPTLTLVILGAKIEISLNMLNYIQPDLRLGITSTFRDQPGWTDDTSQTFSPPEYLPVPNPGGRNYVRQYQQLNTDRAWYVRIHVFFGQIKVRFWYEGEKEPTIWHSVNNGVSQYVAAGHENIQSGHWPNHSSGFPESGHEYIPNYHFAFHDPYYVGSSAATAVAKAFAVEGDAIAISGAASIRWMMYRFPDYSGLDNVPIDDRQGTWNIRYFDPMIPPPPPGYPRVPHPGTYPANGELEPLDAFLGSHGGGLASGRPASESIATGGNTGGFWIFMTLMEIFMGWDQIILAAPPEQRRVAEHSYILHRFIVPTGATTVHVKGIAWVQGDIGTDGQHPTGEGALGYEIWICHYTGGAVGGAPAHAVVASGSVADYTWVIGSPTYYDPVEFSFPAIPGDEFQIGGTITTFPNYHPNLGSVLPPLAGNRGFRLTMSNVEIYANIGVEVVDNQVLDCKGPGGDVVESLTCVDNPLKLRSGYYFGTTRVFKNGLILKLGTDYKETNLQYGEITFTDPPGCEDTIVIWYRATDDGTGGHGLPIKMRPGR